MSTDIPKYVVKCEDDGDEIELMAYKEDGKYYCWATEFEISDVISVAEIIVRWEKAGQ